MTSLFLFNAGSCHSSAYQALSCLSNISLCFQNAVYFFQWLYKLPYVSGSFLIMFLGYSQRVQFYYGDFKGK